MLADFMFSLPSTLIPSTALMLARAAVAAYKTTEAEVAKLLAKSNLTGSVQLFSELDTDGFVYSDDESCIVSFRGSLSAGDWITNALIQLVPWAGEGAVHEGFKSALDCVWVALSESIKAASAGRKLWFAGHSLGGALALLAAERMRVETGRIADGIYTFGMPKVGNSVFASAVEKHHGTQAFAFLNEGDFVPWLPVLPDAFSLSCVGLSFDKKGAIRARPSLLEAALFILSGMIGKAPEEWLNIKPHAKDEYLRLIEAKFGAV
jgi:triacylglycerol lipase